MKMHRYTSAGPGVILLCSGCDLPVQEYTEIEDHIRGSIRFCKTCLDRLIDFDSCHGRGLAKAKAFRELTREARHVVDAYDEREIPLLEPYVKAAEAVLNGS